jgi:tetratricopeptide (TPR) repeat protein
MAAVAVAAPTNASNSATVLLSTGDSQLRQGLYADALRSYQEALALFQQLSDHPGEAKALVGIGLVQMNQNQYGDALQAEQQALALLQQQDDPNEEATALSIIGVVEGVHLFHFALAVQSLERALAIYRQLGDRQGEATTLNNIGNFQDDQDQFADALQSYAEAFVLLQDFGNQSSAARVEQSIAAEQSIVSRLSSSPQQSSPKHELDANASALLNDGDSQYREGRDADALHSYQEALAAFARLRDPEGQAKALMSIAIVQGKTQYADALRAEQQAVALFRQQVTSLERLARSTTWALPKAFTASTRSRLNRLSRRLRFTGSWATAVTRQRRSTTSVSRKPLTVGTLWRCSLLKRRWYSPDS